MAFPLDVRVRLALGADRSAAPGTWTWTDVTAYVFHSGRIQIQRGRRGGTKSSDPASLQFAADNRDGRWSTRNPSGAWYGQIRKGTPVTVEILEGAIWYPRYCGFVADLPPRWDLSGNYRYAPIVAYGLLRGLGRPGAPARSALRRSILSPAATAMPIAYWPCEDGAAATQVASMIDGAVAGVVRNVPLATFAADGPAGSTGAISGQTPIPAAATNPTPGVISLPIPDHTVSDVETLTFWHRSDPWPEAPSTGVQATVAHRLRFHGVSGIGYCDIQMVSYDAATFPSGTVIGYWVQFFDHAGAFVDELYTGTAHPTWDPCDGQWHEVRLTLEQTSLGPVVLLATLYVDGVQGDQIAMVQVLTPIRELIVGSTGYYQTSANAYVSPYRAPFSIAHVSFATSDPGSYYDAGIGYLGEEAHTRFLRLCAEDGVTATCTATSSTACGQQAAKALVELLRELEAADVGLLYEDLDFGLTYQAHSQRTNQTVALALTYTTAGHVAPPLEPTDDDSTVRNDVEVTREGGGTARITESSASVEFSTVNIGTAGYQTPLSLGADSQARHAAGWIVREGTWPGYRFSSLSLNLAAAPALIPTWLACDLGYRLTIASPPDDIGPDIIDQLVDGYAEMLGFYDWDVVQSCSPYGPLIVGVLADTSGDTSDYLGRLDGDGFTLRTSINAAVTSIDVDPAGTYLTLAADDVDPDIRIRLGGEVMAVSAISTGGGYQTLTVTRGTNGFSGAHTAGDPVELVDAFALDY